MTLMCRVAGAADLEAVRALRRAWTEEDAGGSVADDSFDGTFAEWWAAEAGHRRYWLAEDDGEAVGMVSVITMRRMPRPGRASADWGYVHTMYVLPSHRDAGVGAELLRTAIEDCRADGYEQLVLHPRPRALPFYERFGFRTADHLVSLPL